MSSSRYGTQQQRLLSGLSGSGTISWKIESRDREVSTAPLARAFIRLKGQRVTADNFDQVMAGLRQLQPFRIFTVELNGGRRFEVDHPGALVVRDGVAVFIAPGGIPIWFDHESVSQVIGAPASTSI